MVRITKVLVGCLLAGGFLTTPSTEASETACCVTVSGEGIVRISAAALTPYGLSADGQIYVYTDGQAVDFVRSNGALEFYAAPFNSLYTRDRAFLIANRPVAATGTSSTADTRSKVGNKKVQVVASAYTEVCHVEENQYYMSGLAGATPGEEHWFYSLLLTPGKKLQLTPTIEGPLAPGIVRLTVALRGATDAIGGGVNHSTGVNFNGVRVGEVVWGGLVRREAVLELPAGLAVEGANTVELVSQALPGVKTDVVCVDWIEVHYPRGLVARTDRLNFGLQLDAVNKVVVGGFSGEDIVGFDVTRPEAPKRLPLKIYQSGASWSAEWNERHLGERHFALAGPGGRLAPASSRSADPWTLREAATCDYLVVTHENYLEQASRLAGLHSAQGLTTRVCAASAVYDAYGCGQPVPEAVRELARSVRPRYLCLVGDATADPRGFLGPVTAGMVPSFLTQGAFFEEPSDNLMGCVDAIDDYPEIAVGRLPARSLAEAQAMVDKAALRLSHSSSDLPDIRAALVASDSTMQIFTTTGNEMAASFAEWGAVDRLLFASYPNAAAVRAAIIADWAKKPRYFAYAGHASATTLGTNQAIRMQDVPNLAAGEELPAGVILACLAGYFNFTNGSDSIAERMLKEPGKGVCAVVAPAGMSAPEGQRILGRELAAAIADGRAVSLGHALMLAKRRLPAGHGDVLRSFNLLGDPALDDGGDASGHWITHEVVVSAEGNGTISPSGTITVDDGESLKFKLRADSGYQIADLTVDGVSVGTPTKYTLSAIAANHTVQASFEAIPPKNSQTLAAEDPGDPATPATPAAAGGSGGGGCSLTAGPASASGATGWALPYAMLAAAWLAGLRSRRRAS